MAKRDFVSISLTGDKESGYKLTAVATDGSAWIANAYTAEKLDGDKTRSLEVNAWKQIKPLPDKEDKPNPKMKLS